MAKKRSLAEIKLALDTHGVLRPGEAEDYLEMRRKTLGYRPGKVMADEDVLPTGKLARKRRIRLTRVR